MEALEKIANFYEHDMNIKKAMVEMAPDPYYLTDSEYIEQYVDKAADILKFIFSEIKSIAVDNYRSEIVKEIDFFSNRLMEEFASCGYDGYKLNMFYIERISDMREKFVAQVSESICGYYVFMNTEFTIHEAKSINELLHSMHYAIINNYGLIRSANVIETRQKQDGPGVSCLCGVDNENVRNIFSSIMNANDNGAFDTVLYEATVLSVNDNHTIIMLRGLGHATSIEIEKQDNNEYRVAYHIPKICDIDKVNALKGISKVKPMTPVFNGASGVFYSTEGEFLNDLMDFMTAIPSDKDLTKDPSRAQRMG